ncbi:hypothetical protein Droror1_Dr00028199, partial [Drosera rotundifolia]
MPNSSASPLHRTLQPQASPQSAPVIIFPTSLSSSPCITLSGRLLQILSMGQRCRCGCVGHQPGSRDAAGVCSGGSSWWRLIWVDWDCTQRGGVVVSAG